MSDRQLKKYIDLATNRQLKILEKDQEIERLRDVLKEIAQQSMGECGCYYTNKANIGRAKEAIKQPSVGDSAKGGE